MRCQFTQERLINEHNVARFSCRCVWRTPRPYRSDAPDRPIRNDGWRNHERWCIRHMLTHEHCAFFTDALEGTGNYGNAEYARRQFLEYVFCTPDTNFFSFLTNPSPCLALLLYACLHRSETPSALYPHPVHNSLCRKVGDKGPMRWSAAAAVADSRGGCRRRRQPPAAAGVSSSSRCARRQRQWSAAADGGGSGGRRRRRPAAAVQQTKRVWPKAVEAAGSCSDSQRGRWRFVAEGGH